MKKSDEKNKDGKFTDLTIENLAFYTTDYEELKADKSFSSQIKIKGCGENKV